MGAPFAPNEVPTPVYAAALAGKPVSRSVGLWNFQGTAPEKEKCRSAAGEEFCRGETAAKWSGVLRGGWSFRDNPRWGSVQNEHDHILWMVLDQSTKSVGFVTENIMVRKARQDGFEKFIVVKRW